MATNTIPQPQEEPLQQQEAQQQPQENPQEQPQVQDQPQVQGQNATSSTQQETGSAPSMQSAEVGNVQQPAEVKVEQPVTTQVQSQTATQPATTEVQQPVVVSQQPQQQPVQAEPHQVPQAVPQNDARSKARGAAYNEIAKRWGKHGEGVFMHDGVPHVMLNGVPKPLVDNFGNVLDTDGVYKKLNDDGSLSDAEQTEDNNELLHNMFDYFDAHNGDVKSVNDPDFLITEAGGAIGGTASMRELAEQLGVENVGSIGWKRRLLDRIKEEYTNRKANRKKSFDEFDRGNVPVADEDLHLKTDDGADSTIPKDAINEFFRKCKEFHTTQRDNPAMYKLNQGYVKNFQQYMHDFMEKYPAAKEAVQKGINWTGANGLKFPVDADYGQNTTSVMWHILGLMGGDDALKMVGAKYDPDTDRIEADNDGIDPVNEWYARQGLESQERHEEKRNDRMKVFNNMAELVSGIGDIVGGSQGVEIKDRAEEIGKEADALENRRTEIKKEFDAKMIDLKDKQQKARTEKQKQRYELMMAREKMKFEEKENKLNRDQKEKLTMLELEQQKALAEAKMRHENYNNALDREIKLKVAKISASSKGTLKLDNQAFRINGKPLLLPSGFENDYIAIAANTFSGMLANPADYGITGKDKSEIEVLRDALNPQKTNLSTEERRAKIEALNNYASKYPKLADALGKEYDKMQKSVYETFGYQVPDSNGTTGGSSTQTAAAPTWLTASN